MGSRKPKVEVRSTTGQSYRRAGIAWPTSWTEVEESKFTGEQLEQLSKDPHLDLRVDGKRVIAGGVRVKDTEATSSPTMADVEDLVARMGRLEDRNGELRNEIDNLDKKLALANSEKADLEAKLTAALTKLPATPTTDPAPPVTAPIASAAADTGKPTKSTK